MLAAYMHVHSSSAAILLMLHGVLCCEWILYFIPQLFYNKPFTMYVDGDIHALLGDSCIML